MLAVPSAELATTWLVADAICAHVGFQPSHILAIGDCRPVATVLNAASSASPQMRTLLRRAYELCDSWLAAAVPRLWNTSADAFTHAGSDEAAAAVASAEAAGLEVERVAVPASDPRWLAVCHAATETMRSESDMITVGHADRPTEGATAVSARRPGPLGNPFSMRRHGRLDEHWRPALCDAFHWAHQVAMDGGDTSLAEVAALHGLPPSSVQAVYGTMQWHAYSSAVRDATRAILARAADGERLCLTCTCHPRRCHAATIVAWLRGQLRRQPARVRERRAGCSGVGRA